MLNRAPDYISELRRTSSAPVFSISSDHVEIGRIQGRQFAALLPDGGSVLYIEGPSHSASAKNRTLGMLETKPSNIQVTTLRGQWTEESAWKAVRSWLQLTTSRRAALDVVGAQDDSMAMGARKAFQEIADEGKWSSLLFTGCDGLPNTGQAWVRKGLLAATVCIPPIAGQAIENLIEVDSEWNKATGILGDHVLLNPPSGCTECAEVITCCRLRGRAVQRTWRGFRAAASRIFVR